jgi:hypothetical protein
MLLCKVKHWRRRCQVYLSGKEGKDYLLNVSLNKEGISAAKVFVGISPGEGICCLIIGWMTIAISLLRSIPPIVSVFNIELGQVIHIRIYNHAGVRQD